MNMDEKTIKEALLKGERVTLECKRAKAAASSEIALRIVSELHVRRVG